MESTEAMKGVRDTIDSVSPRPSSLLFLFVALLGGIGIGMLISRR